MDFEGIYAAVDVCRPRRFVQVCTATLAITFLVWTLGSVAVGQPVEMDFTLPQKNTPEVVRVEPSVAETPLQRARTLLARAQRLEEQGGTQREDLIPLFEEAAFAYRAAIDGVGADFVDCVLEAATAFRGAERPVDAAELCARSADDRRGNGKRGELSLCAVYAYRHALNQAEETNKLPKYGRWNHEDSLVRAAIAVMERFQEESIGRTVDMETRHRVLFVAGELRERVGQREAAESLYWTILQQAPGLEVAEAVVARLLEPSQTTQNWEMMAEILEKLRDIKLATEPETQRYGTLWGELSSSLAIRRAQEAENASKWEEAAAHREQAAAVATETVDKARACYQAAYALDKAERLPEARLGYEKVLREFPESDVVPLAMLSLGTVALKLHDPAVSAELFVRYSEKFPTGEHAVDALFQGVRLWVNDNRLQDAVSALERFVNRAPKEQEIPSRMYLADLYEKTGAIQKGLLQYEAVLANAAVVGEERVMVHTRAGLLCERLNNGEGAQKHFRAAVKTAEETGVTSAWVDRARAKAQQ